MNDMTHEWVTCTWMTWHMNESHIHEWHNTWMSHMYMNNVTHEWVTCTMIDEAVEGATWETHQPLPDTRALAQHPLCVCARMIRVCAYDSCVCVWFRAQTHLRCKHVQMCIILTLKCDMSYMFCGKKCVRCNSFISYVWRDSSMIIQQIRTSR